MFHTKIIDRYNKTFLIVTREEKIIYKKPTTRRKWSSLLDQNLLRLRTHTKLIDKYQSKLSN